MKTQVAIIGAGPSGLMLARYLAINGIESIVLEDRDRDYVEARIRAGLLETQTVDLLNEIGVADRLYKEGLEHNGVYLQIPGQKVNINFKELIGYTVWVYGQTQVQRDLGDACEEAGQPIHYEVKDVELHNLEDQPYVTFTDKDGNAQRIDADFIAGCDGFWGPSRKAIPGVEQGTFERVYPYGWLGVMADVAPSTDELIYARHPKGFAMHSMRSNEVSRLYLQVDPNDDIKNWSDDRIWSELSERMAHEGWELKEGPITEKSILAMRSFVSGKIQYGKLFLVGDAGHIVPPTGAKGLNAAANDVRFLGEGLVDHYKKNSDELLNRYEERAKETIWRVTHFSWMNTVMLHINSDEFDNQLQLSQLKHLFNSRELQINWAKNYVGIR
ncbi:MAG: 4-hydroxybenzoate 3-monooxygenase [Micrococcales bacterium]